MDLEFDDGGCAEVATGPEATTTMEIDPEQDFIGLSLDARWSSSMMSLGVRMSSDQAKEVGEHLLGLARELEETTEEE